MDPSTSVQAWPTGDASLLAPVQEHDDLRKVLRDLLGAHAGHEQVRRAAAGALGWSADLWHLLNEEMNVSALAIPEDRGGLGFGVSVLAVVLEEAGRALLPEPLLPAAALGAHAVSAAPAGEIPDDLVAAVLTGELVTSVVGRTQAGESALVVSEDGGALTVSGRLDRVLVGAAADLLVVPAGVNGGESIYLVDLRDAPRASRVALEVLDPTRRLAVVELIGAPAYLVAGPEHRVALLDELAVLQDVCLAAEHVGMTEALLEMTRTYTLQREQFGRPLASFQAIKHRLADVLVDLERSRSAARYAAALFDQDPSAAALPAAVAAVVTTDAVIRAAHETVQLHGGIGFTWEHPAHYYLRRALADEAVFGGAHARRNRVADLVGV